MQLLKEKFKIIHYCLWIGDEIYLCSREWNKMHEADKVLLFLYKQTNADSIITDVPIYLTHTSLVDDMRYVGHMPYRFVIMQLSELFSFSFVSDPELDINRVYEVFP